MDEIKKRCPHCHKKTVVYSVAEWHCSECGAHGHTIMGNGVYYYPSDQTIDMGYGVKKPVVLIAVGKPY